MSLDIGKLIFSPSQEVSLSVGSYLPKLVSGGLADGCSSKYHGRRKQTALNQIGTSSTVAAQCYKMPLPPSFSADRTDVVYYSRYHVDTYV